MCTSNKRHLSSIHSRFKASSCQRELKYVLYFHLIFLFPRSYCSQPRFVNLSFSFTVYDHSYSTSVSTQHSKKLPLVETRSTVNSRNEG